MPATKVESRQALAATIARRLYGFAPTAVVRLSSEHGFVFRVEFGGLPAKVIKLPGRCASLLREQRVIRALRQAKWALPVPAIEFTQEDLAASWEDGEAAGSHPRVITVMPMCPGMALADAIVRDEPWAGEAMRAAGGFAARLTEVPPVVLGRARRMQSEAHIGRAIGWVQPVIEAFGRRAAVQPALDLVAAAKGRPPSSLGHGEFFPENILVQPAPGGVRLSVLDWERARPSSPVADLAALIASLARLPLRDAGNRAYLRRRAIDGFAALRSMSERDAGELKAYEVLFLLSAARFALDSGRHEEANRLALAAADAAQQ